MVRMVAIFVLFITRNKEFDETSSAIIQFQV